MAFARTVKIMLLRLHLTKWAIIIIANLFRIELYACVPSDRFFQLRTENVRHETATTQVSGPLKKDQINNTNNSWKTQILNANEKFIQTSKSFKNLTENGLIASKLVSRSKREDPSVSYQREWLHRQHARENKPSIFMTKIGTAVFKIPFEESPPFNQSYAKFVPTAQPVLDSLDIETIPPYLAVPFPKRKRRHMQNSSTTDASTSKHPTSEIPEANDRSNDYHRNNSFIWNDKQLEDKELTDEVKNNSKFDQHQSSSFLVEDHTFYSVIPSSQDHSNKENKDGKSSTIIYKPNIYQVNKVLSNVNEERNHEVPEVQKKEMRRDGKNILFFRNIQDRDKIQFEDSYSKKTTEFIRTLIEDAPWETLFLQMVKEVIDHFIDKTLEHLFSSQKDKRSLENLVQPFNIINRTKAVNWDLQLFFERLSNSHEGKSESIHCPLITAVLFDTEYFKNETIQNLILYEIFNIVFQKAVNEYADWIKISELSQFFLKPSLHFDEMHSSDQNGVNTYRFSNPGENDTLITHKANENIKNKVLENNQHNSYLRLPMTDEELAQGYNLNNSLKVNQQLNKTKVNSTVTSNLKNIQEIKKKEEQENSLNNVSHKKPGNVSKGSGSVSKKQNEYSDYLQSLHLPRQGRVLFPFKGGSSGDDKIHIKDSYGDKTLKFIKSLVEDAPWESMFMRMVRMVVDHFVEKTLEHLFASHKDKRSLDYTTSGLFYFPRILKTIDDETNDNENKLKPFIQKLEDKVTETFSIIITSLQAFSQQFDENMQQYRSMLSDDLKKATAKECLHHVLLSEIFAKLNSEVEKLPNQISFNLLPYSQDKQDNNPQRRNYKTLTHKPITTDRLQEEFRNEKENFNLPQESGVTDVPTMHPGYKWNNVFNNIQDETSHEQEISNLFWNSMIYDMAGEKASEVHRTKRAAMPKSMDNSHEEALEDPLKYPQTDERTELISNILLQQSDNFYNLKEKTDVNYLNFLRKLIINLKENIFQNFALTNRNRIKRSNKLWYDGNQKPPNQKRYVGCSLRSACNAGRLLSRLPSIHEVTMQLRTPEDDEPHWDALLWGMKKKRCTHLTCKRYRAPKGSKYYNRRIIRKEHLPLDASVPEGLRLRTNFR